MDLESTETIEMGSYIDDNRSDYDFKTTTFSKFNKNEVKKTLLSELAKGRIENACHWCAELICSGHLQEVWDIFLFYLGKHIYLGNPKLIVYLENRWKYYQTLVGYKSLEFRNDTHIRKLFAEIICFLCQSKKRQCIEPLKISIKDDFDVSYISTRVKAISTEYSEGIFKKDDPKPFFIAINEFCYSISKNVADIHSACYWIEWIIEFDGMCRKKKNKEEYQCMRRHSIEVEPRYQMDVIWIIWDALFYYSKQVDPFIDKIIHSLLGLFCIHYNTTIGKKRHYLLFLATGVLIDSIDKKIDLILDRNIVIHVMHQIDDVYKEIKNNNMIVKRPS